MTYLPGFENPVGYITAIRQWQFERLLHSIVVTYTWEPWTPAEGDPYVPYTMNQHGLGVYAVKLDYEKLLGEYWEYGKIVTGTVALWGKIVEHEWGYRAQYAYPLSFEHCTNRYVDLNELRELYLNPPTDKSLQAVKEKLRWISEKRKGELQYSPSVFHTTTQTTTLRPGQVTLTTSPLQNTKHAQIATQLALQQARANSQIRQKAASAAFGLFRGKKKK